MYGSYFLANIHSYPNSEAVRDDAGDEDDDEDDVNTNPTGSVRQSPRPLLPLLLLLELWCMPDRTTSK